MMKKIIFLFFLPLWGLGGFVSAHASVTVTPLSTDFTNKKVTFRVVYSAAHNNRAWVWIDLCPVSGVTPTTFQTAVISAVSATGGSVDATSLNGRGFYVTTNPSTITATLSNAVGKFNWCAYGSDYPPNVTYNNVTYNGGTYTFKGTPPFKLVSVDGLQTKEFNKKSITVSEIGFVPKDFTDATSCPGLGFCPYTGNDEVMDATHFCHLRTSGAQNWETWIKDTRDNELYRIVYMPDNNWWLAQNVKYAQTGASITINGCTPETCGRWYASEEANGNHGGTSGYGSNKQGVCPNGWTLPVDATWATLMNALAGNYNDAAKFLISKNNPCPKSDDYGWASDVALHRSGFPHDYDTYVSNTGYGMVWLYLIDNGYPPPCSVWLPYQDYEPWDRWRVRCFRQL
jgi:uncharacterized protein (TIGR02145 family)